MIIILYLIIAYVIGSFPTSYILTKLIKGIDIREHGSKNPGATNVFRVVGPIPGISVFLIDALKGFIPVFISLKYIPNLNILVPIGIGLLVIIGHMWTVFLKFKGGKGVATGAGVFFALLPFPTAIAFASFWIIVLITRYVSISSMSAAVILTASAIILKSQKELIIFATLIALIVIVKHKSNIKNLIAGKEYKFGQKKSMP